MDLSPLKKIKWRKIQKENTKAKFQVVWKKQVSQALKIKEVDKHDKSMHTYFIISKFKLMLVKAWLDCS